MPRLAHPYMAGLAAALTGLAVAAASARADPRSDCLTAGGEAAIKACTTVLAANPKDVEALAARAAERRDQGDFAGALTDYGSALAVEPANASLRHLRGLALFDSGDFKAAADDLGRAVAITADPHDALFRYLATRRSGGTGEADLAAFAGRLKSKDWPLPVIELFLGRLTPEAVRTAAKDAANRCEAEFYVGQWHLLTGETKAAEAALSKAAETCPDDFIEHDAARAELKRLPR
jgi:lipoprotein NlpI